MEKLTFFALSAPEKLDRIAAYLSERLTRELNRHRYGSVLWFLHINQNTNRSTPQGVTGSTFKQKQSRSSLKVRSAFRLTFTINVVVLQVRVHSDGGDGAAAAGLSLSEHQPAGGEFPRYTETAAGDRQTAPAHPRHKLCTKRTQLTSYI